MDSQWKTSSQLQAVKWCLHYKIFKHWLWTGIQCIQAWDVMILYTHTCTQTCCLSLSLSYGAVSTLKGVHTCLFVAFLWAFFSPLLYITDWERRKKLRRWKKSVLKTSAAGWGTNSLIWTNHPVWLQPPHRAVSNMAAHIKESLVSPRSCYGLNRFWPQAWVRGLAPPLTAASHTRRWDWRRQAQTTRQSLQCHRSLALLQQTLQRGWCFIWLHKSRWLLVCCLHQDITQQDWKCLYFE